MIFKSKEFVYDRERDTYTLPIWVLDTDTQTVKHINPKTMECESFTFHSDHIRYHLHYVEENAPERLQRLLDNGEIYKYLDELDTKVTDAVNEQAQKFMDDDVNYRMAVDMGRPDIACQIGNNWRESAKEAVYSAMVYV